MWPVFKTIEVIKGRPGPKVSLADQLARSRAPHLLVSAGAQEKEWGELYDRAAATAPSSGTCRRRPTPPR